jgi:hypothetical protein
MAYFIVFSILGFVLFIVGNYAKDVNDYNNSYKSTLLFSEGNFKYNLTIRKDDNAMLSFKIFDKNNNEVYFNKLGHDLQELVIKAINTKLINTYGS